MVASQLSVSNHTPKSYLLLQHYYHLGSTFSKVAFLAGLMIHHKTFPLACINAANRRSFQLLDQVIKLASPLTNKQTKLQTFFISAILASSSCFLASAAAKASASTPAAVYEYVLIK